jgi:hypothetical protein
VIDLSDVWNHPQEMLLSTLAADIEYIPLETTPDCLLKDPLKIQATVFDRYVIVNSGGMKLFDRKGKYLRSIGSRGKGPQEYLSSSRFALDEKSEKVYILDDQQHKVIVYHLDGTFGASFPIAKNASRIVAGPPGRIGIMYLPWTDDAQDTARFEWINETGRILATVPLYVGRPKDGGEAWGIAARLYWHQDRLLFAEWPFDTAYYLRDDRAWTPVWTIDPGKGKMPREVSLDQYRWSAERNNFTMLVLNYESSRYLFFDGELKDQYGMVLYDKSTSKAYWTPGIMSADSLKSETIINDLDGGINIYSSGLNGVMDDQLTTLISPIELIARFKGEGDARNPVKRPELREKLKEMVGRIKEEDNPVVMVVKLNTMSDVGMRRGSRFRGNDSGIGRDEMWVKSMFRPVDISNPGLQAGGLPAILKLDFESP